MRIRRQYFPNLRVLQDKDIIDSCVIGKQHLMLSSQELFVQNAGHTTARRVVCAEMRAVGTTLAYRDQQNTVQTICILGVVALLTLSLEYVLLCHAVIAAIVCHGIISQMGRPVLVIDWKGQQLEFSGNLLQRKNIVRFGMSLHQLCTSLGGGVPEPEHVLQ